MSTAVSINSVSMRYGKKQALREVSLNIPEASIFSLIGPSGCGKTTLVKILMGLLKPTAGSINIFGEGAPNCVNARQTGYMAQAAALYPLLTGRENLEFFGKLYGLRGLELKERIGSMAQLVRLNEDLDTQTQNYSGGMLRRLSLAVALLHNPRLLILDEPTVGIDPLLRSEIWKELRSLATAGITVLITTHVMDEAEKCDRLAMMRDGQVLAIGSASELIERAGTSTFEQAFIKFASGEGTLSSPDTSRQEAAK